MSQKAENLARSTYQRVHKTLFNQPFLYDKLNVRHWPKESAFVLENGDSLSRGANITGFRTDTYTRWDIASREKDLKLFIKVPASCRSTITVLEGDYRCFNNSIFAPVSYKTNGEIFRPEFAETAESQPARTVLEYQQNHSVLNFDTINAQTASVVADDVANFTFKPISKLQLLAFNNGESYPFADRLIEYLAGSAITPAEEIPDNIKRVQRVMKQNGYYFRIEGLWENKMQKILYDYMMSSGPIKTITICDDKSDSRYGKEVDVGYTGPTKQVLKDLHQGTHPRLGHTSKSLLYDVLGYVDKDVEKWYASWKKKENSPIVGTSLQSVDIYNGLYDI
jgi:hypothetical protein